MLEDDYGQYMDLARKILSNRNHDVIVASLLRHVYDDEFLKENYNEIKDVSIKVDDKTRLFIALGQRDGMKPSKLLELLHKKAKVPGRKIRDIKIMDKFSFITVPFKEAEEIMKAMNRKDAKKPIVEISNGKSKSKKGRR